MCPIKERLQSALLYKFVANYGSFHQHPTPEAFGFLLVLRHSWAQSSPSNSNHVTHRNRWHFRSCISLVLAEKEKWKPQGVFFPQKNDCSSHGWYSRGPICSNRALTGSCRSRAQLGHPPCQDGKSWCMHRWASGDAATEGLASHIQGLFAFQSVHLANIGKNKAGRETLGRRGGLKISQAGPFPPHSMPPCHTAEKMLKVFKLRKKKIFKMQRPNCAMYFMCLQARD